LALPRGISDLLFIWIREKGHGMDSRLRGCFPFASAALWG
jgi:hypothetical protein